VDEIGDRDVVSVVEFFNETAKCGDKWIVAGVTVV
jgi:hypothetical protein